MKFLLFALAVVLAVSCNPVKKVLQDPAKTQKVMEAYMAEHPSRPDTVHLAGRDTILVRQSLQIDSIPLPYPVNHRYTETYYRDRVIHDTLVITKCDGLEVLQKQVAGLTERLDRAEDSAAWWQKAALFTWGILALGIGGYIFTKLR